jgi:hypothetical protein
MAEIGTGDGILTVERHFAPACLKTATPAAFN